ncbi:MAG TPA: aspartyl protease family protein [Steroidobacteraceae bacterium]|nr:aspartyl protease family protein [Steroidobacteraceae bacterium]
MLRALLLVVRSRSQVLLVGWLLGLAPAPAWVADTSQDFNNRLANPDPTSPVTADPASTNPAVANSGMPTPPAPSPPLTPSGTPAEDQLAEIVVQTSEPRFVAPTRRDRIGRIWAPVLIDGKGPYRLVLDTGANRSAITARTAALMGLMPSGNVSTRVTGFTGSAVVPTIHADHMEVGELLMGPTDLPVLADVFGGAQGVLGNERLTGMRIYADFSRDQLVISRSHGDRARGDFTVVPLEIIHGGLLLAHVRVGSVRAKAIVDTGAQGTIGNLVLRDALMRRLPRNVAHEQVIGVTLDVQSGDTVPMPDIDFGHLTVQGVRVTFGDMYLFKHWKLTDEPTLTLGMDLLGSFDVLIIDYKRHEMQIRLRNSRLPF